MQRAGGRGPGWEDCKGGSEKELLEPPIPGNSMWLKGREREGGIFIVKILL